MVVTLYVLHNIFTASYTMYCYIMVTIIKYSIYNVNVYLE